MKKGKLISIKDYVDLHAHYQEKLRDQEQRTIDKSLKDLQDRHTDALKMLFSRFEAISDRFNSSEGKGKGVSQLWGWLVAGAATLASITAIGGFLLQYVIKHS